MTLWEVIGGAILIAVVSGAIRGADRNGALYTTAIGGVLLAGWAILRMSEVKTIFHVFSSYETISPYVGVLLRAVGVGYVVKIAADICRDLGASETADKLELCGKAELVIMALPYLVDLVGLAMKLTEGGA